MRGVRAYQRYCKAETAKNPAGVGDEVFAADSGFHEFNESNPAWLEYMRGALRSRGYTDDEIEGINVGTSYAHLGRDNVSVNEYVAEQIREGWEPWKRGFKVFKDEASEFIRVKK